jgi:hypothetical protein
MISFSDGVQPDVRVAAENAPTPGPAVVPAATAADEGKGKK